MRGVYTVADLRRALEGLPGGDPVVICTGDAACYYVRAVYPTHGVDVDDGGDVVVTDGVAVLDTTGGDGPAAI